LARHLSFRSAAFRGQLGANRTDPSRRNLLNSSWVVRRYAGVPVALRGDGSVYVEDGEKRLRT
jgi:hypothetical protein